VEHREDVDMPTYIALTNFTEQGVRNIKELPERWRQAQQRSERMGEKITLYLTMGQYDAVAIIEAPDDETAARGLLTVAQEGHIRTITLKAFSREETERIIRSLG
jgi:uncharacterized protein with GYD domain